MTRKSKVAVFDDHPIVRRGIAETLAEESDFEIVAEGATAADACRVAANSRLDLMLLDAAMPGDGIEAARKIAELHPKTKIVIFTIREDSASVRAALKAGACGYIAKGVEADELVTSLRRILAGEKLVSSALAAQILSEEKPTSSGRERAGDAELFNSLTEREKQLLNSLRAGLSNERIADELGLQENTIKHYMTPLFKKLGVRNRTEAALRARSLFASD